MPLVVVHPLACWLAVETRNGFVPGNRTNILGNRSRACSSQETATATFQERLDDSFDYTLKQLNNDHSLVLSRDRISE